MRANTITANPIVPPVTVRPGRRTEVRDPYDGLRPWSAITHGVGAALALAGTALLLARSAAMGKWLYFGLFAVYGLSMVCLYTASTLYHCLNGSVAKRLALRKYDHCSIYLLIAGSYTGSGTDTRTISLGFTPRLVFVISEQADIREGSYTYGGIALKGQPGRAVAVVEGGFSVRYFVGGNYVLSSNGDNCKYFYWALR